MQLVIILLFVDDVLVLIWRQRTGCPKIPFLYIRVILISCRLYGEFLESEILLLPCEGGIRSAMAVHVFLCCAVSEAQQAVGTKVQAGATAST
jgi:hypothetical protein